MSKSTMLKFTCPYCNESFRISFKNIVEKHNEGHITCPNCTASLVSGSIKDYAIAQLAANATFNAIIDDANLDSNKNKDKYWQIETL